MLLNWSNEFNVGIEKIDHQHKELFDRINVLLVAMREGKGKTEVINALNFLEEYVQKHFSEEEALQKSNNYPKHSIQHEQHEEFKKELIKIREKCEKGGLSTSIVLELQKRMTDWWRDHIITLDKDMGKFINSKTE